VLLVIAAISLPHTGADYTEHGGTCTHFYKLLVRGGTVSRRTANKKATKQLPFRKALAKTTCRTKKLEKHDKKIFRRLAPDTYPPLLNSFWCHWPRSPSQCNIALISFDLKWPQLWLCVVRRRSYYGERVRTITTETQRGCRSVQGHQARTTRCAACPTMHVDVANGRKQWSEVASYERVYHHYRHQIIIK